MESVIVPSQKAALETEPLAGAFYALLAFFAVYCARPEDWIPGVRLIHPALIVGALALLALLMSLGRIKQNLRTETLLIVLLLVIMSLSSLFSPVWKGGAFHTTRAFADVVLIILVMAAAVSSLRRLTKLVYVQTASVALIALISLKTGHLVNGRLSGALSGIYQNPNDLAIAVDLTLPFCLLFFINGRSMLRKILWGGAGLVMVYTVLRTGSRAGLIALVITGAICLWEFGVKGKRNYLWVLGGAALLVLFLLAGQVVTKRFESAINPQEDPTAYASAQQRRQMLIKSLKVTAQYPVFGVGPGNFEIVSGAWRQTHDVYTEYSAECGIPALMLFLLICCYAFKNLKDAGRRAGKNTDLGMFVAAVRAGLIGFLCAAFFYPDGYQYYLFFLFGYATALALITAKQTAEDRQSDVLQSGRVLRPAVRAADGHGKTVPSHLPVNLRPGIR